MRPRADWPEERKEHLRTLWYLNIPLSEISKELGRSKSWCSEMAHRLGMPTRKMGIRYGRKTMIRPARNLDWVPDPVTKICYDCLGRYQTTAGDYSGHPECPKQRKEAA